MSVKDIIESGGIGLILLMTLIQITPIKVNPWERLFKLFGKWSQTAVMEEVGEVKKTLEKLDERVDVIEENIDDRETKMARYHIYRFADEISRGEAHSREFFDQILDDINTYESYCAAHPDFKNDKANTSIRIIRDIYAECVKNNSFL